MRWGTLVGFIFLFSSQVFAICEFEPLFSLSNVSGDVRKESFDQSVVAEWVSDKKVFRLFNLKNLKTFEISIAMTTAGMQPEIDMSPDGKTIIVWNDKDVIFVSGETGKIISSEGRTLGYEPKGIGFTEDGKAYIWVTEPTSYKRAVYIQYVDSGLYKMTYLGQIKTAPIPSNQTRMGVFVVQNEADKNTWTMRVLNAETGHWFKFDIGGELGNFVDRVYYSPYQPVAYVATEGNILAVNARTGKMKYVVKGGTFNNGSVSAVTEVIDNRYIRVQWNQYIDMKKDTLFTVPFPEGCGDPRLEQVIQNKALLFSYNMKKGQNYVHVRTLKFTDGREIPNVVRASAKGDLFTREEDVVKIMDVKSEEEVWRLRFSELTDSMWIDFSDDSRYLISNKLLGNNDTSLVFYDLAKKRKAAETPPLVYGRVNIEFPRGNPAIFKAHILGERYPAYYKMPLCQ